MFAPLGEIIRNGIAKTTPSGLFFAIGEQLNALSGLALCLIMAWSHMDNPRRNGTLFMSIGLVWFLLCGVLCGTLASHHCGRSFRPRRLCCWSCDG